MLGDEPRGSLLPFGAALVVFALVVIGIAIFTMTQHGDGLTEEQRVGRAAVAQNDALQRQICRLSALHLRSGAGH